MMEGSCSLFAGNKKPRSPFGEQGWKIVCLVLLGLFLLLADGVGFISLGRNAPGNTANARHGMCGFGNRHRRIDCHAGLHCFCVREDALKSTARQRKNPGRGSELSIAVNKNSAARVVSFLGDSYK